MPEVILILFKINLVLLLFAAAYFLVLRRLTFYTLNRVFLVGGIIFSTVYPFINLTDFFNRQEQINPVIVGLVPTIDVKQLTSNYAILDYWQIVSVVFYLGVAFMAFRLIGQFLSLYRVHRGSKPGAVRNLNVRILKGRLSPFSFWQTVYINPDIHSESELDTILAHEQVHVKEWHTLDIILAEVSVVFYWFNPGVWLMKRAIKENIEFITDARIVKKGIDKKAYQYSLLGVGNLQASVSLVNNFNLSDLKKRIKMMNAKRSSPRKLLIYAFILPVLLVTTLAFTVSKKEMKKHLMPFTQAMVKVDLFKDSVRQVDLPRQPVKENRKVNTKKLTVARQDTTKTVNFFISTITLKSDSLNGVSEIPEAVKLARDEMLRAAINGMGKGVKTSSFTYKTSDSTSGSGAFTKTENIRITLRKHENGKEDPSKVTFNEVIVNGFGARANSNDSLKVVIGKPTFRVNGKVISEEELSKISAEDIKSVSIQKGATKGTGVIVIAKKN